MNLPQRKRNRMLGFDYSTEAIYFITSNCKDRLHHFGEVENGKMILNKFGEIAKNQIEWLAEQYPYLIIHNSIIMPNHIHILMEIDKGRIDERQSVRTSRDLSVQLPESSSQLPESSSQLPESSSQLRESSSQSPDSSPKSLKIKSISSLMGAYKTTTSKLIHLAGNPHFEWHRSFYDNIVRNQIAYSKIDQYITDNPKKWKKDLFNKESNKDFVGL
jgi:REP element-mobilizing transposase RayT